MAKEKSKKLQNKNSKTTKTQNYKPAKKRVRNNKNPKALERLKIIKRIRKINRKELKRQLKKKIDLFYKISFSLFLLLSIVLFYFVVIVSTSPKSIPYVTEKINEVLEKELGKGTNVRNSAIKFTRYGTLKISVTDFHTFQSVKGGDEMQDFDIPKIEAEFSLLDLLLLKLYPSKLKVFSPNIIIDNFQRKPNQVGENLPDRTEVKHQDHTALIISVLSKVKNGDLPIRDFEIENAKIFYYGQNFRTDILLKKSRIRASVRNKILYISSVNKINFNNKTIDVDFNSNCQLSRFEDLQCDLALENFIPESVSDIHPSISFLDQINASLNAVASFSVNNNKMSKIVFKADAPEGSFEFLSFFSQKMKFKNLSTVGEYDDQLGILKFSDIEATILTDLPRNHKDYSNGKLKMKLMMSDLKTPNTRSKYYIKLQDVPGDEIKKYWPSGIKGKLTRKWVTDHISGGIVSDAYADFSLISNNEGSDTLEDIDAQINFAGFNLKYSKDYPEISNIDGIAKFDKKGMKIAINEGDVLESKIKNSVVKIEDFSAGEKTMLEISGKIVGKAYDTLKHISHKSEFSTVVKKYINGPSTSEIDIKLPINKHLTVKNFYLSIKSQANNVNGKYTRGPLFLEVNKDFNSTDFVSRIDLSDSQIFAKAFDIHKASNLNSSLDFIVSVANTKNILIKNISLTKTDENYNRAKVSGYLRFDTTPFSFTKVSLKNNNFGKNNYSFFYSANAKKSSQSLSIQGSKFNVGSLIKHFSSISEESSDKSFAKSSFKISVTNGYLLSNKILKNLSFKAKCYEGLCYSGYLRAKYNRSKNKLNLIASKELEDSFAEVKGEIENIGYLAEGFGISNLVSGGDAEVELTNKLVKGQQLLSGDLEVDNDITVYETATVKRLAKDDLFSKIKDQIFSSEKTTFDNVKLNFSINKNLLTINSLIANNFKIGVTAKGFVHLTNDFYSLKGMIVPGFIINNLFGIGNIPIIGGVISGLLTGGQGGGVFGIKYEYVKEAGQKDPIFTTNKVSSFIPTTIKNLFDLI